MAKNKQLNLIASLKMLNIDFINKYIINSEIEGGYSVLVGYQSLLSIIFPSAPPQKTIFFFCIKYTRNRLLRVSFIELQDFMI